MFAPRRWHSADWQFTQREGDAAERIFRCASGRREWISKRVTPEPVHIWFGEPTLSPSHMWFWSELHAAGSTSACKEDPRLPPSTSGILLDASPAGSTWPTYSPCSCFSPLFSPRFIWPAMGCCDVKRKQRAAMLRIWLGIRRSYQSWAGTTSSWGVLFCFGECINTTWLHTTDEPLWKTRSLVDMLIIQLLRSSHTECVQKIKPFFVSTHSLFSSFGDKVSEAWLLTYIHTYWASLLALKNSVNARKCDPRTRI